MAPTLRQGQPLKVRAGSSAVDFRSAAIARSIATSSTIEGRWFRAWMLGHHLRIRQQPMRLAIAGRGVAPDPCSVGAGTHWDELAAGWVDDVFQPGGGEE
jgi:hypothetical protein